MRISYYKLHYYINTTKTIIMVTIRNEMETSTQLWFSFAVRLYDN
jgi:hypothetical protein